MPIVVTSALVFTLIALVAGAAIGGSLVYVAASAGPGPPGCLSLTGPSGQVVITLQSSHHGNGTGASANESSHPQSNSKCFTFSNNNSGFIQWASSNGAVVNVTVDFGPFNVACSANLTSCPGACPQYVDQVAEMAGAQGNNSYETADGFLGGGCQAYLVTAADPDAPWQLTVAPSVTIALSWHPA